MSTYAEQCTQRAALLATVAELNHESTMRAIGAEPVCLECYQVPAPGSEWCALCLEEHAERAVECTQCAASGYAPVHWCGECQERAGFVATGWPRPVYLAFGVAAEPGTACVRRRGVQAPEEWCAECQAWARTQH